MCTVLCQKRKDLIGVGLMRTVIKCKCNHLARISYLSCRGTLFGLFLRGFGGLLGGFRGLGGFGCLCHLRLRFRRCFRDRCRGLRLEKCGVVRIGHIQILRCQHILLNVILQNRVSAGGGLESVVELHLVLLKQEIIRVNVLDPCLVSVVEDVIHGDGLLGGKVVIVHVDQFGIVFGRNRLGHGCDPDADDIVRDLIGVNDVGVDALVRLPHIFQLLGSGDQ